DVQDQEDPPDCLRDFERAAVLGSAGREVGLHVQGCDDAEDDGENGADEYGKEIVNARPPAAQSIESLQMKAERHQRDDERQHVDVLPQRRHPLRDRNQHRDAGMEAERVGGDERDQCQQRVREDVEGDKQPVVAIYHADGSATSADIWSPKRARLNCSAWARMAVRSKRRSTASAIASANAPDDSSSTSSPVSPGLTVSTAPPRPSATTGRPHACASSGTMPKSSSPGRSVTAARR